MKGNIWGRSALWAAQLLLVACTYDFQQYVAEEGDGGSSSSGGSVASSGGSVSAGAQGMGGTSAGGGATGSGGAPASGGATGNGGRAGNGGAAAMGGAPASGGAASATCAGKVVGGLCWYLGQMNQSCTQTCMSHGGVNPTMETFVGTTQQGGSLAECVQVLSALGVDEAPIQGSRTDAGLGCHVFPLETRNQSSWWLDSPRFSASARLASVSVACACQQ